MKPFLICTYGLASVLGVGLFGLSAAQAWGPIGHRVVGEIAERALSVTAQRKWAQMAGGEHLWEASTWMDEVKSYPEYDFLAPFHYLNIKSWDGGFDFSALGNVDVGLRWVEYFLTQRQKAASPVPLPSSGGNPFPDYVDPGIAALWNTKVAQNPVLLVRALVHLMGDVHQPFHMGLAQDRGGNDCRVKYFGQSSSLHGVWDDGFFEYRKLSFTEWADRLYPKTTGALNGPMAVNLGNAIDRIRAVEVRTHAQKEMQQQRFEDWAKEIQSVLREQYLKPEDLKVWRRAEGAEREQLREAIQKNCLAGTQGSEVEIAFEYSMRILPIVEEQLFRAGVRLAAILERVLATR